MGEADVLRRAMSGKYRGQKHFELIREKYFHNCREEGYPDEIAQEAYFPAEFMVAVINNFGGFYSRELYFHELKKTVARVEPPCINEGAYLTTIREDRVHVGFIHIDGLEKTFLESMLAERDCHGPFLHLHNFIERTGVELEPLNRLIRIGALRFTGRNKKELLWEANFLQKKTGRRTVDIPLFEEPPIHFQLPELAQSPMDDALDEIELLGFPLGNGWDWVDADPDSFAGAPELAQSLGQTIDVLGYYITNKAVRTIRSDTMYFGTFLDKRGQWLDTVHFPGSFQWSPFEGAGFYSLRGTVVEEFGVYSIEVGECRKLGIRGRE